MFTIYKIIALSTWIYPTILYQRLTNIHMPRCQDSRFAFLCYFMQKCHEILSHALTEQVYEIKSKAGACQDCFTGIYLSRYIIDRSHYCLTHKVRTIMFNWCIYSMYPPRFSTNILFSCSRKLLSCLCRKFLVDVYCACLRCKVIFINIPYVHIQMMSWTAVQNGLRHKRLFVFWNVEREIVTDWLQAWSTVLIKRVHNHQLESLYLSTSTSKVFRPKLTALDPWLHSTSSHRSLCELYWM